MVNVIVRFSEPTFSNVAELASVAIWNLVDSGVVHVPIMSLVGVRFDGMLTPSKVPEK
jgi:hypothetical protein